MKVPRSLKSYWLLTVACLLLLTTIGPCVAQPQQQEPPPFFNGTSIPEPPGLRAPWTPPQTGLPEVFVTATSVLFAQGLSNPLGGEYREVEIVLGSVWGGAGKAKVHAWVLPARAGERQRFAVCWNGLVTPLVSVGEKADLRLDVSEMVKADALMRAKWNETRPNWPFYRLRHAWSEGYTASHKTLLPLKAGLLLRLGEVDLAEQVWNAWALGMDEKVNDGSVHLRDPYVMLATDWAYALFDRAVCAHMRGDDKLALLSARALAHMREAVSAELEKRSALWPQAYRTPEYVKGYLAFLEPLPLLLADQERRAREGKQNRTARRTAQGAAGGDTKQSVEALIADLELVAARQWGQPGGVSLTEDATVRALIAHGEEAVAPLVKVLEADERLTRSVSFHRDFFHNRHLIGVHEAAYAALVAILKTSAAFKRDADFQAMREGGLNNRRAVAARIRSYLERYGGLPLEERWYRTLADDSASTEEWMQAAANIVSVFNYDGVPPAWAFVDAPVPAARAARNTRLRGESLRDKDSPSVAELFIRRMRELAARRDDQWHITVQGAANLALALLAWDGREHLAEAREFQKNLRELYEAADRKDENNRGYLRSLLVSLYLKRCEAGDPASFDEYAAWVGAMRPVDAGENVVTLLRPVWRFQNNPVMRALAQRLFGSDGSPWLPLIDKDDRQSFHRAKLLETPMLDLVPFREQVLKGLADKSIVGTLRPRQTSAGDSYHLIVESTHAAVLVGALNSPWANFSVRADDTHAPARPLAEVKIRACDVYARMLMRLSGAPPIEVYWTEAERDRAVEAAARFIREHQGRFADAMGSY
jgi:hypothetical protein